MVNTTKALKSCVLGEAPFNEMGSVAEIFDDIGIWMGIRKVIDVINQNAKVA